LIIIKRIAMQHNIIKLSLMVLMAISLKGTNAQSTQNSRKSRTENYSWNSEDHYEFKKEKKVVKTFAVKPNMLFDVENSFGEMKVTTWDKNEIAINISITAEAKKEAQAERLLESIRILEKQKDDNVYVRTKTGNGNSYSYDDEDEFDGNQNGNTGMNCNNCKFTIDYDIKMPKNLKANLTNSFGKMIVPDLSGDVNIESKFGSLQAGVLSNEPNVTVEFGKAFIQEMNGGELIIKFCSASQLKVAKGVTKVTSEFSGKVSIGLSDDIEKFSLNEQYGTATIAVSKNFSAEYLVTTNFGNFQNNTTFNIKEEKDDDDGQEYSPKFDKRYTGASNAGGAKRIRLKDNFGKIILTHTLPIYTMSKDKDNDDGDEDCTDESDAEDEEMEEQREKDKALKEEQREKDRALKEKQRKADKAKKEKERKAKDKEFDM
jgi:hypothetical protein